MANPPRASILPDLQTYLRSVAPDAPYENLGSDAAAAGWIWRLRQVDIALVKDGLEHPALLVHFEVLIGKELDKLEVFDTVSVMLNAVPGPISAAARLQLTETLLYLFFGRLPPKPPTAEYPKPNTEPVYDARTTNAALDQALTFGQGSEDGDDTEPEQEPIEQGTLNVVIGKTPDGLPLFEDLYALGEDSGAVVDAFMDVFIEAINQIKSIETLHAFYNKSVKAVEFVKDFRAERSSEITRALNTRKGQIEGGFTDVPRRRSAAAAR